MDISFEQPAADIETRSDEGYRATATSASPADSAAPPADAELGRDRAKVVVVALVGLPIGLFFGVFIAVATGLMPLC